MTTDDYYYFYTPSGGLYCFDDNHNVYFHDGTLVDDSSDSLYSDNLPDSRFRIEDASFWFDNEGLMCQSNDGSIYPADVWKNERRPSRSQTSDFLNGGSNDTNRTRGVKRKKMEDEQGPPSKVGAGNKHYFYAYASSQVYYFDKNRKLYSEDGKLIHDGSASLGQPKTSAPNFHIEGVPYWFEVDGLSSRVGDDTPYRIHTWLDDHNPEPLDEYPSSPDSRPIAKNRRTVSPPRSVSCSPVVQPKSL